MRPFFLGVTAYAIACLIAIAAILIHGDGPHPRVVAIYPPNGDRYWPGGEAQITFSQSMAQSSVERSLTASPGTQGQGAWYGNTLNLAPDGGWKDNVTYHLALTGTVTDDQGRPMRTPFSFWFRVHYVHHLAFCPLAGVRNVCERVGKQLRPITHAPQPVLQYTLSGDGTLLAYTRHDTSGLPHLFIVGADGTYPLQLTRGTRYVDSSPSWQSDDSSTVWYQRRPILSRQPLLLGKPQTWSIGTDGTENLGP